MFLEYLKKRISDSKALHQLQNQINCNAENLYVKGIEGSLKALILAHIFETTKRPVFFACLDDSQAESIKHDLELLLNPQSIAFFPAKELFVHKKVAADVTIQSQRMESIEKLMDNDKLLIVASARGIARKVARLSNFRSNRISLAVGKTIGFDDFIHRLAEIGYKRQPMVEMQGDLSVRGGLIDVFLYSKEDPVRIEFFGDEIESIRFFDIETQLSASSIKEIVIYPKEYDSNEGFRLDGFNGKREAQNNASLFDYVSGDAIVFMDEPELIGKEINSIRLEMEKLHHLGEYDIDLSTQKSAPYFEWEEIDAITKSFFRINLISFKPTGLDDFMDFQAHPISEFKGNLKQLKSKVEDHFNGVPTIPKKQKEPACFICEYSEQIQRMRDLFEEVEILPHKLTVKHCGLSSGFYWPDIDLLLITHHEFYGRYRRLRSRRKTRGGLTKVQLQALVAGDYIVHEDYGVGKFLGLKKITVGGSERECIHVLYKENGAIYVPLERMNRVQKYSAKEGAAPALSRLGGSEWQKLKKRTKSRIKDIAKELIALYAARKASKGFAFAPDSHWQKELEASFLFDETPDQEKTVTEVKKDMESEKPMDRLVCGDVGFGKTEVAIRAAFKALNDNKQVAVLVPTTILAQQHYNTFSERLAPFPVKVEMLSRFRTKHEQGIIIKQLADGKADIIIGTHRILSKDIKFKELGLLVVDEEQRFGVTHKERIKTLKENVDVLTLTATPIPRTLHMSLIGARDMSNIDTAPKNRLPVYTEVLEFDKDFIREAIIKEMQRGGQVFFVHNRVQTIDAVADMIRRLVPEASVVVGHGQMYERRLEKIMLDFMHGKHHVLVATMIIENGLDLPNVNTIIIHRADRFGLAQLYQLRGRVGRSPQRAYAYLLIPPIRRITNIALKRLRTIEEFTELGAGFKIAMRDLEIRGAGNILGAEQSGFIDVLGFDLYCKILDEALNELKQGDVAAKDEADPKVPETKIEVDVDIHIPSEYIELSNVRLDFYRRLVDSKTIADIDKIEEELIDRFGKLPEPADNLLNILRIKLYGKKIGLYKISVDPRKMLAYLTTEIHEINKEDFQKWIVKALKNAIYPFKFMQDDKGLIIRLANRGGSKKKIRNIKKFLQSIL